METRKLARIEKILKISPIKNADAIEVARVGGWDVVVKKGQFDVGNKVVFFEVDSWVQNSLAPYLTPKGHSPKVYEGVEGNRLRTIKLRGQISQGLIMSLEDVEKWLVEENGVDLDNGLDQRQVGEDLTAFLGIKKYEPPLPAQLAGDVVGLFPSFIAKTDEIRCQSMDYASYAGTGGWTVTEKLDGSSMTVFLNGDKYGVCSRNLEMKLDSANAASNTLITTAISLKLEEKLRKLGRNLAIQGELIGPGIQKNKYKLDKHQFRPFTVFNIDTFSKLPSAEALQVIEELGLTPVPVLSTSYALPQTTDELLKEAEGKSELNNNTEREGIVLRSASSAVSFKAISNKFLLKCE